MRCVIYHHRYSHRPPKPCVPIEPSRNLLAFRLHSACACRDCHPEGGPEGHQRGSTQYQPSDGNSRGDVEYRDKGSDLDRDLRGSHRAAMGAHFMVRARPANTLFVSPFKTVQSPIEGTATLTENQAADLLAGKWYANVHTAANPGGELRGQMMK